MTEDLIILLEWLNANGITDFFNEELTYINNIEDIEGNKNIIELDNTKKTFNETIECFVKKQNNMYETHINKIDYIQKSKNLCDNLNSIDSIISAIDSFDGFNNLKSMATNTVFYSGNCNSNILIINDFPNENDDVSGKVFSNESEELMYKMLKAIEIEYDNCCYINSFFWRLAGNRVPIKEEFDICKPFVEKFISIQNPKLIIFTGNYSISNLTNFLNTIVKTRGKFFHYTNEYMYQNIDATSLFGPNFLIKNQLKKREAWNDLLMIKDFLDSSNEFK